MSTSGKDPDVLVDTSVAIALSVADHEYHATVVDALDGQRARAVRPCPPSRPSRC